MPGCVREWSASRTGLRATRRIGVLLFALLAAFLTACIAPEPVPIARFSYAPKTCYRGVEVRFTGEASTADGAEIATYTWSFGDGGTASGEVAHHEFTRVGAHKITLTVTTESGATDSASLTVTVMDAMIVPDGYRSIQEAIDASWDGDVIVVLPGDYVESLRLMEKNITLKSVDPTDAAVVAATRISGKDYGKPTLSLGSGTRALVEGLTLRPGPSLDTLCEVCLGLVSITEASPSIRSCRIENAVESGMSIRESGAHIHGNLFIGNRAPTSGGAIHVDSYRVAPSITGNVFEANSSRYGGAVFVTATAPVELLPAGAAATILSGNTFLANNATLSGGAVYVEYSGNLRLDNPDTNTYDGNTPDNVFYIIPPS